MNGADAAERSKRWLWIGTMWLAGGMLQASQSALILRYGERKTHSWLPLFGTELATWLPWALATPLIVHLARRYPIIRGTTLGALTVHVLAFVSISAVAEAWSALLQVLVNPWGNRQWPTFWNTWRITLLYQSVMFLIAYALVLTITFLVDSRDKVARQAEELSRAQLAALRRQMEPHFMFNTLNSIAGLVRDRRNDSAVSMIVGLSEFLRRTTERSHRPQVTVAEEVEYLQRYVDIQQIRFGDRLVVGIEIPAELMNARVPDLLLQPLVENAIKHGIAQRVAGGIIRVAGSHRDGRLVVSVYNDGPGPGADEQAGSGIGLANLRTRLQILHGDAADVQMRRTGDGVEVIVALPYTEA